MSVPYKRAEEELRSLFMLALKSHDSWPTLIGSVSDGRLEMEVLHCPSDYGPLLKTLGDLVAAIDCRQHMEINLSFPRANSSPKIVINVKNITHTVEIKTREVLLRNTELQYDVKTKSPDKSILANKVIDSQFAEIEKLCKPIPALDMRAHYMACFARKMGGLPEPLLKKLDEEAIKLAKVEGKSTSEQLQCIFTLVLKSYAPDRTFTSKNQAGKLTMEIYDVPEAVHSGVAQDISTCAKGFGAAKLEVEFEKHNPLSVTITADTKDEAVIKKAARHLELINPSLGPYVAGNMVTQVIDKNNKDYPAVNMNGRLLLKMAAALNVSEGLQKEIAEQVCKEIKR